MANVTDVQTIQDGDRNLVLKITGVLDTGNVSKATLVDVSALVPAASLVHLRSAKWSVQEPLSVNLYWNANTDLPFLCMSGADHQQYGPEGNLPNNAGAGVNGDVEYETTGYASGTVTYTAVLVFVKTPA